MIILAICADELYLLFFLAHTLDLMSHLLYHDYFLGSWLCLTQNVLTWKFDSSLWECC